MSHAVGYPDRVNGHHLYRRDRHRHDRIQPLYQCTSCGQTAEHFSDFRALDCPGGEAE